RTRSMNAWAIEHTGGDLPIEVKQISRRQRGPFKVSLDVKVRFHESEFTLTYEIRSNDPTVYLHITGTWFERGNETTGTPVLTLAVPTRLSSAVPSYEVPFGSIKRDMKHGEEVPALRWAALEGNIGGKPRGLLMMNDSKHGHSAVDNTIYLTLIRGSFDPDPLPEIGKHEIHVALRPLDAEVSSGDATRLAQAFDHPVRIISTDAHEGGLPSEANLIQWHAGASVLASVKKAEDGPDLIIRAYNPSDKIDNVELELNGKHTGTITEAKAVDLLERPTDVDSVTLESGTIRGTIAPRAIWSARIHVQK
ncbi:MAG: hypothetical protein HN368_19785, partial [Spirochaetales bacterium]|nr:hypothetical protein [Spirochaetales bacterium]